MHFRSYFGRRQLILGVVLVLFATLGITTKVAADIATSTEAISTTPADTSVSASTTETAVPTPVATSTGSSDVTPPTSVTSADTGTAPDFTSSSTSISQLLPVAITTATSTAISVQCSSAYTADLYDTPSGHLDPAYIPESQAASTSVKVAHLIGSQSWAGCRDDKGHTYELKITPDQYSTFGQKDGYILESIDQKEADEYRI